MPSRYQSQECHISIPLGKTLKISYFYDQSQFRMRMDAPKVAQLFHIFLITCFGNDLFDPLIVTLDFCVLFLIRCHVFIQCFPIHWIEICFLQPGHMPYDPFRSGILISMAEDKRIDLLFQFLEHSFIRRYSLTVLSLPVGI